MYRVRKAYEKRLHEAKERILLEEAKRRAQQEALRSQGKWWKSLDGEPFEKEVCKLLEKVGHNAGYTVRRTGKSGDEGVDIVIIGQNKELIIVQCKAQQNSVGPGAVRDLYGALMHHRAREAWLECLASSYTTARFSGLLDQGFSQARSARGRRAGKTGSSRCARRPFKTAWANRALGPRRERRVYRPPPGGAAEAAFPSWRCRLGNEL